MTKLELLISQLCPNGVETYKLKEVCSEFIVPMRDKPKKFDGTIPWCRIEDKEGNYFHRSKSNQCVSETTVSQMNLKIFPVGTVICSCSASIGSYAINTQPLITNQTFIGIVCGDKIFNEYLRYYMETQTKRLVALSNKGTIPYISRKKFEELLIPVPPLPVQEEIVRILDKLTEKTDKLISEATVELDERKKQYEYYKRQILLFDNPNTQWVTLGDIGKVSMCKRIMKSETSPNGDISFYKIGTFGCQANAYISKETFEAYKEKYSYPKKGDILISAAGTIGRTVIFDGQPAYFQDSNIVWIANDESKVLNCFLNYYYQTQPWQISTGGTISRLYNDNISSAKIPLISKEEQLKIVSIIEKCETVFSNYTNSIKEEITARKQQYEYYRDKLLTF